MQSWRHWSNLNMNRMLALSLSLSEFHLFQCILLTIPYLISIFIKVASIDRITIYYYLFFLFPFLFHIFLSFFTFSFLSETQRQKISKGCKGGTGFNTTFPHSSFSVCLYFFHSGITHSRSTQEAIWRVQLFKA